MFNKKAEKPEAPVSSARVDTLIGKQTEIQGDIHFAGGLHIDGKVKGKIVATSDKSAVLSVSETGSIEGDVRVPHVNLNGTVQGDVHAGERLQLSAKARVNGNVYYKLIEMAIGATVNGQMVHEDADKVEAITHQRPKAVPAGTDERELVTERKPATSASS